MSLKVDNPVQLCWVLFFGGALLVFLPYQIHAVPLADSSIRISADFAHFSTDKRLSQDLYFSTVLATSGKLWFRCYRYAANGDSLEVYGQHNVALAVKSGVGIYPIKFGPNDANSFVLPVFYDIVRNTGIVPAGAYKMFIQFTTDSGTTTKVILRLQADSTLPATSSLSDQLNNALLPKKKSGIWGATKSAVGTAVPAARNLERSTARINRIFKSSGLTPQTEKVGGKVLVNLWYEDWFVGRYELDADKTAASQIENTKAQIAGNVSSLAGNDLEGYRSLFSQVRELTKNSKEDNELKGELAVSGNWSNGQPEYAAQDNNFYEVRGQVETEVMDVPISLEGFYTTQDAHRQIKSSYARVHYDADRAKEKLMKLITGFQSKYSQTASKGKGLDQVYGSYLGSLDGMKTKLVNEIAREAGIPYKRGEGINTEMLQAQIEASLAAKMRDTAALMSQASGQLDSSGKLRAKEEKARLIKDSAAHLYARAMKRYEAVKELEVKYEKYQALLNQYKNTSYFDSALVYSKIKDLKNGDEASYKQLAKSASGLLPEGKAKTFIAGLTNLDAGIFPKYVSKYTIAGQQLKGLDAGYDIGFATVGFTVGSIEYAGRDGSLDKYTSYSGRLQVTPIKGQHASLVYYGYTPSKSMLKGDDFFKNTDISLPSFRSPVHIVSAVYDGVIAKNILVDGELATSFRSGSGESFKNSFDADRIAWHLNAEGRIPKTTLGATASYEHGGKNFQNSTMPVMISGADLYKLGLKADLFRSFLTAGIEFNHMQQSSFTSKGGNSRWGFDIATHSRQYPSVALSYKPFATFRSYSDTFAIPQRPLQGAVWTGKASYQIKRVGGKVYRFTAVLNKSISHTDTVKYSSDLVQLNASYSTKQWMLMLSVGQSMLATNSHQFAGTDSLNPAHVKTSFAMLGGSYSLSKGLNVSGGLDLGVAPFGLSKWGVNAGLSYRMKKAPLTVRTSCRYSSYKLAGYSGSIQVEDYGTDKSDPMSWRKLVNGNLELIWQFKMKLKG